MAFSKVSHVIFDMDGLLLDTEKIYMQCYTDLLERYGKSYTYELRNMVLGTVEEDCAKIIVSELNLPVSSDELRVQVKELQRKRLSACEFMPGAEKLIRHLSKHQIPIAVATSSGSESVELKISNHRELFGLFSHMVKGSSDNEVKHGKPAPDIFLVCASRFSDKPPVEKCLVFEDAPNGVVAGRCAGMQVVMVPDEYIPEEKQKAASHVLKSLTDFKPELFGLPPFEN